MREAQYVNPEAKAVPLLRSGLIEIDAGMIRGVLSTMSASAGAYGALRDSEREVIGLAFSFDDADGRQFKYGATFDESLLMPKTWESVEEVGGDARSTSRLWNRLRVRDLPSAFVEKFLVPRNVDIDRLVTMWIRDETDGIVVRVGVARDPDGRPARMWNATPSFEFHLPLEHLLWRPDNLIEDGQLRLQAADYVRLTPLTHPRPKSVPIQPCPIRITGIEIPEPRPSPKPISQPLATTPFLPAVIDRLLEEAPSALRPTRVQIQTEEQALPLEDGRSLKVGPGTLRGVLRLAPMTWGQELEWRPLLVTLDFLDLSGRAWRYASVCGAALLFPMGRTVRVVAREPKRGLSFEALNDSRNAFEISVEDGPPLKGQLKYAGTRYWPTVRKDASELDVTLWFFCPDDPRSTNDHIVVRYTLPIDRLLWLKAPRLYADDVMPQDTEHIAVFGLDRAPRGISASPVTLDR